jgi:hypothetical protein
MLQNGARCCCHSYEDDQLKLTQGPVKKSQRQVESAAFGAGYAKQVRDKID